MAGEAFPPPDAGSLRHVGPLAAVLLLGLFAYSNSLHGPFVFDDAQNIRDNPLIRDLANYVASWAGYRGMPNRFVAFLTFALNYRLGGLAVAGYHAFNLAVHLLCATLLYSLVVLTFRTPRMAASSLTPASRSIAFAAAALFVAHPIQTQAVTYIVQRITSLATLFYVLSLVLYAWWRLARRNWTAYVLALLAAVAAMKTKEIAFTLPFTLVLYEFVFFDSTRRRWLFLAPFLATALIIPATLLNMHAPMGELLAEASERTRVQATIPRLDYLRTEIAVVATYLRLLVLPVGQNLDHDFPIYTSILAPRVLLALCVIASLLAGATWLHVRASSRVDRRALDPAARLVSFGVAWFFLTLLVESSVIPIVDVIYEHRVYLPSIGFFTAAAAGGALLVQRLGRREPARLTSMGALFLALILSFATLRRNEVWADDVSLWADAVSKSPAKPRPLYNLGSALATTGRPYEGLLALRRAVRLDPTLAASRAQLGATLANLGQTAEAEPQLREAIRLDPKSPQPIYNLAMLLSKTGRASEAKVWFTRFLDVAPPSFEGARGIAASRAGQ